MIIGATDTWKLKSPVAERALLCPLAWVWGNVWTETLTDHQRTPSRGRQTTLHPRDGASGHTSEGAIGDSSDLQIGL